MILFFENIKNNSQEFVLKSYTLLLNFSTTIGGSMGNTPGNSRQILEEAWAILPEIAGKLMKVGVLKML